MAREFEHVHVQCKMEGCFIVDADGQRGSLPMLWKDGVNVYV